jgi:hypothetical protein
MTLNLSNEKNLMMHFEEVVLKVFLNANDANFRN